MRTRFRSVAKLINLSVVRQERRLSEAEAWQRYVDAVERSKATLKLEDGIAAGKAYVAFLEVSARRKL